MSGKLYTLLSPAEQSKRQSISYWLLSVVDTIGARSTCNRGNSGCVIARDGQILATGYSGSPAGLPHCDDIGHWIVDDHCVRTIHAEQNAIAQAAKYGVALDGCTLYCTMTPCLACAKLIVAAGIKDVICNIRHTTPELGEEFLYNAGVGLYYKSDTTIDYESTT